MSPESRCRLAGQSRAVRAHALVIAALAVLSPTVGIAQPQARHGGAWTPHREPVEPYPYIPVHIALLPGTSPTASKILWWNDSHDGQGEFLGKLWNWTPAEQNDCATFPDANFEEVALDPPDPRIFCSGFTPMRGPGGRLFITGGTEGIEFGSRHNTIYDATTNTWSSGGLMAGYRWYPTVTSLHDGRALILSGSKYFHTAVIGGRDAPGGSPRPELNRFVANQDGLWDPSIAPQGTIGVDWPEPRSYHAAAPAGKDRMLVFGGELADGAANNDVWELRTADGSLTDADVSYSWAKRVPFDGVRPGSRRRMGAVTTYGDTLWVIGGLGRNVENTADEVKNDVWRFTRNTFNQWQWTTFSIGGEGPGPRFGHTAVFDRHRNRILVFGGAATVGGPGADDEVYALDLKPTTLSWARLEPRSALRPPARLGHGMVYDRSIRPRDFYFPPGQEPGYRREEYRAILFGGEAGFGVDPMNDLWHLWITAQGQVEWVPFTNVGGTAPTPRAWLGTTLDDSHVRLIVYGGTTGPGAVADGQVHTLDIDYEWPGYDSSPKTWRTMASQPFGLTGHSMAINPILLWERRPETVIPGDAMSW